MPPKKKAGGAARPRKTATGYRMPDHLPPGTAIIDLNKKRWLLGESVGTGGFGEIYLAREGGTGPQRVVKIEPHENGPLFVEMHFYISALKPEHLQEWNKNHKGSEPHLPLLRGQGSHMHKGDDKYRFLVIDRLGKDLDKFFNNGSNPLSLSAVSCLAVEILNSLEYIHSAGYTHNDVKAANLLFGVEEKSSDVYLVDFGLCVKYRNGEKHKEYKADPRKAHDGTIEYLSRDAHIGCTSRRSDLEVLGFNLVHWLTGSLPWLSLTASPAKVQAAKVEYFSDLNKNISKLPKPVQQFLKLVTVMQFEQEPDYNKMRQLFTPEVKKCKGKIQSVFTSASPVKATNGVAKSKPEKGKDGSVTKENTIPPTPPVKKSSRVKAVVAEHAENGTATKRSRITPKRQAAAKKLKEETSEDEDEEKDMFADSPSPVRKKKKQNLTKLAVTKEFVETGCQTSPAFVTAAKAARQGRQALAQSEYTNQTDAQLTPSMARRSSRTASQQVEKLDEVTEAAGSGQSLTPAMRAVLERKQQVDKRVQNLVNIEKVVF